MAFIEPMYHNKPIIIIHLLTLFGFYEVGRLLQWHVLIRQVKYVKSDFFIRNSSYEFVA